MTPSTDVIEFTEKMVSGSELHERWPGLKLKNLTQYIDERIEDGANPDTIANFPEPFYLIGTKYITNEGNKPDKLVYICEKCISENRDRPSNWKPYKTRKKNGKRRYYLKRVVFIEIDIENYESIHKNILYSQEELNKIIDKQENIKNAKQRLFILQKDAAALCEVSPATIRNWDKGIHQPQGYPGRHDSATFILWAKARKSVEVMVREARAVGRALPMNPAMIEKIFGPGVFHQDEAEEVVDND